MLWGRQWLMALVFQSKIDKVEGLLVLTLLSSQIGIVGHVRMY